MAWVDKRLRQVTTHLDIPLSIILIGDFAQLPSVGDHPLFAPEGSRRLTWPWLYDVQIIY